MTLLAIDPGRSVKPSIGWALFRNDGSEIARGKMTWAELCKDLRLSGPLGGLRFFRDGHGAYAITEVVIENFVNDPRSARGGQENGTSECIGAVEILATQAGISFTRQRSDRLNPAKLLAGYEQTTEHIPDQDSAYLHGYYYLVNKGVLGSKGLEATL